MAAAANLFSKKKKITIIIDEIEFSCKEENQRIFSIKLFALTKLVIKIA